jgi:hypothetical protein
MIHMIETLCTDWRHLDGRHRLAIFFDGIRVH